ncbi:MAG TPA: MFS transporter [Roseiflexaceae bacterium]|nr:MFS transporter [Roseiflexaceae bacterium]HMP41231.1 MFS transporter [Roseiflexaceae bacterium]
MESPSATLATEPTPGVGRYRALATLALGHFAVDSYSGVLPVLFPLLVIRFDLDLKTVGLVLLAYSGCAAISQPFFGWLADRFGTRYVGLALLWTALVFATIGFAGSFPLVVAVAAAAGLGSGAYHPFGALSAHRIIPPQQRNRAMAMYVTGGTLGVAVGPLIGIALFSRFGLQGTAGLCILGLVVALWMLWELRHTPQLPARRMAGDRRPRQLIPWRALAITVSVMMSVNGVLYSVQAFTPTWYAQQGYSPTFYGTLATTLLLAHAAGAVVAGALADRFGRRLVIIGSFVVLAPALLLYTAFTGPIAFLTIALVGLSIAATGPLLLINAQQLMADRAGMASGMILGLGFVTGAIGVPITGAIGDVFGLEFALRALLVLVAAGFLLAWFLPPERRNVE